jgi:hypothetical protein
MPRLLSRIAAVVAGLATTVTARADAPPAKHACVTVRAEAPYRGSGYDHLVKLQNHCDRPVKCAVSSDVNPEGAVVTVAAKSHAEVLLWRGSPARTFKARVRCD